MENPEMVNLPEKQKHQLRHRELFLSRQLESLPATHIRYVSLPSFLGVASISGCLSSQFRDDSVFLKGEMLRDAAERDRSAEVVPGQGSK